MTTEFHGPIALVGMGSIGTSFAALYLRSTSLKVRVYDPRPDLTKHLESALTGYLNYAQTGLRMDQLIKDGRLEICSSLEEACRDVHIVQEQGPENLEFKASVWPKVLAVASSSTHLWSSTSGITASRQIEHLEDKTRLLVVHPFNPPHIMPLIEIVPSPQTKQEEVDYAKGFFQSLNSGHQPVVLKKELPGFVGNRLAFVLFREALHLVSEGVVSVEDLDKIVENSVGPRWAVTGPIKAYNYGGGAKGLAGFLQNLSTTIENIWQDSGNPSLENTSMWPRSSAADDGSAKEENDWATRVVEQTREAYGLPTSAQLNERDDLLNRVLRAKMREQ